MEAPRGLEPLQPGTLPKQIDLIVIGISTGGPNALRKMFAAISRDLPVPIVVVQHMPAGFTYEFAKSLDRICPLVVKEAEDGEDLKPGHIYIAPGDTHVQVHAPGSPGGSGASGASDDDPGATGSSRSMGTIRLNREAPENGHRPSADVLFRSAAKQFGNRCLAVIMTGMGRDGAREIGTLYANGAATIGQDPGSCVVYGMPKVAYDAGYLYQQVPLSHMADTIAAITADPQSLA